jgi:hypothetical protein
MADAANITERFRRANFGILTPRAATVSTFKKANVNRVKLARGTSAWRLIRDRHNGRVRCLPGDGDHHWIGSLGELRNLEVRLIQSDRSRC